MYKIVEFDDGIMTVPNKWVDVKKNICKWPHIKVKKLKKQLEITRTSNVIS